ncbi:hypothetical protein GGR51DRAFT_530558 [Nemania sp. FL0031]|nr:hypothetical protein GGR51DRAFT_530558 [Nemania sp. FL0031]
MEQHPVFNDPNITASFTQTVTQSIDALKAHITKEPGTFKDDIKNVTDDLKNDIDDVRNDLKDVKNDLKDIKNDIKDIKDNIKDVNDNIKDVKEEIKTSKNELTARIDTLDQRFQTSIATREYNSLVRASNASGGEFQPLHSVFTNAPIAAFPGSLSQFRSLNGASIVAILEQLNDPYCKPELGTPAEKRVRLWMLAGVPQPSSFPRNPVPDPDE